MGMANTLNKDSHMWHHMPFVLAGLFLVITGCATTEFKPFEAKVNAFEGGGGHNDHC